MATTAMAAVIYYFLTWDKSCVSDVLYAILYQQRILISDNTTELSDRTENVPEAG